MHGQGYYKQSGGYEYDGLFENNLPAKMATRLIITIEDHVDLNSKPKNFEIYEGQNFQVLVRAIDDDGQIFKGFYTFFKLFKENQIAYSFMFSQIL